MAKRENISVSFTPEQVSFLSACVGSGRYQSTSEAVREGVRLLEHQHKIREAELNSLRDKIAAGAAELNAGRVVDGDRSPKASTDLPSCWSRRHGCCPIGM